MGRYINPFTDWGFKRLFGQEFSKDLLINFLNDLFEGEFQIKDVTFKDKEQLGDTNDLRGCIFDIYCVTDDGKHFIVEMQNRWVPFFAAAPFSASPTRPEGAEAPSPGQHPGY